MVMDDNNKPQFSIDPSDVCMKMLKIFDEGLNGIKDIESVESKVMPHFFKKRDRPTHKVPIKPDELPELPNPLDK